MEAYSKDEKGYELIINYFLVLIDLSFLSKSDVLEAFNFSLANFLDLYIDYPKSIDYANDIISWFEKLGILTDP